MTAFCQSTTAEMTRESPVPFPAPAAPASQTPGRRPKTTPRPQLAKKEGGQVLAGREGARLGHVHGRLVVAHAPADAGLAAHLDLDVVDRAPRIVSHVSVRRPLARIALCELASHLLKKVLPEVSARSEEAPIGGAHVSALVASLGEADRAQVSAAWASLFSWWESGL